MYDQIIYLNTNFDFVINVTGVLVINYAFLYEIDFFARVALFSIQDKNLYPMNTYSSFRNSSYL